MSYQFLTQATHVFVKTCAVVFLLGTTWISNVSAQNSEVEQIANAHEFVVNRNWASAEALLVPLTQSQPKNPFIFYDLAQVYENTNRIELAKQVYQGLTNTLGTDPNQYTIVVRAPYASRLVSLVSLAQAKLNAINAKQAAMPVVANIPPPPMMTATSMSSPPSTSVISVTSPTPAPIKPLPNNLSSAKNNNIAVSAAMKSWAAAWANKDLNNYYASYVNNFHGELPTRSAWENKRRETISRESNIEINFRNLQMTTLSPTSVQAKFIQTYFSDTQSSRANKTLLFTLSNGRWLIERESTK